MFGPNKGKGGDIGKTEEQLIADLIEVHSSENWLGDDTETSPAEMTSLDQDLMKIRDPPEITETHQDDTEEEAGARKGDPHCYECKVKYRDPTEDDLVMYLHALRYQVQCKTLLELISNFVCVSVKIGVTRPSCQSGLILTGGDETTSEARITRFTSNYHNKTVFIKSIVRLIK